MTIAMQAAVPPNASASAGSGREQFLASLLAMAQRVDPSVTAITGLARVSAGATLETWALDAERPGGGLPLILRRSPGTRAGTSLPLSTEAEVLRAAGRQELAVPAVWHVLRPEDELGDGFLMNRIPGETLARRIIRDAAYAGARQVFAAQIGTTLGKLHDLAADRLPTLPYSDARTQLARMTAELAKPGVQPRPVFELAIKWLEAKLPEPVDPRLVHGDFRLGNLIVGENGLRAVLDWEVAHLGDPAEDLAWLQIPPWRFGVLGRPVGGVGRAEDMYAAYAAETGRPVDVERVRFWQVLGSLRWGVSTAGMVNWLRGGDTTVERAMIARRASENELDLLRAIMGRD
ncbi:Predicted kinase, aminoglycoside phosphotransferase (APT) family [Sphingomonas sp. OV641]|uniref:phosphotransferase family protein n=1 Tax=Sphingomonas sp. OV641 TaxID=1881068 RepID=UPI0008CE935F|nr:phosphotransferase family protein [Sphingomonas sp. OV641]SEJ66034.1 Predicted kinase, aminoglycoside phosphotransferase (APT) family [Sphingomonas sp. OV641]